MENVEISIFRSYKNAELFMFSSISPYVGGMSVVLTLGLVGYKYPKVIHLTIFALPLMFLGG